MAALSEADICKICRNCAFLAEIVILCTGDLHPRTKKIRTKAIPDLAYDGSGGHFCSAITENHILPSRIKTTGYMMLILMSSTIF